MNRAIIFRIQFRFASKRERLAIGLAIFLSILVGMCSPFHTYLCGVITTLYVDVKEVRIICTRKHISGNRFISYIFQPIGNLEFLHQVWRLSSLYGVFFVFTFTVGYAEVHLHSCFFSKSQWKFQYLQNWLHVWASERISQRIRRWAWTRERKKIE